MLNCSSNNLITLLDLPSGLQSLVCSNNRLTSLPVLPDNLKSLTCSSNDLTSLPILPETLAHLDCSKNQLPSEFYINKDDLTPAFYIARIRALQKGIEEPKKIQYYIIKSSNKEFYCKVIQYFGNYTITVGGKKGYCLLVIINKTSPTEAYIRDIAYDDACAKDGNLEKMGGIYTLIACGLYCIKEKIRNIQRFSLTDASHIQCIKGSQQYKMDLAYDSILKYNQTWYQRRFHATLPPTSLSKFEASLKRLDMGLPDFKYFVSIIPSTLKDIYLHTKTPREFIETIRSTYKENYCFQVAFWLDSFLEMCGIHLYRDEWYIPIDAVVAPEDYSVEETQDGGGGRRLTRKKRNFRLVKGGDRSEEQILGVYDSNREF
jgi:hypothetical protein